MWYCKMYFPGRHEVIESDSFGTQGAPSQRKVFPFLESLLSFTELDIGKVAVALRCISDDLESLDRERVTNAMAKLGALADTHSFFRVLYAGASPALMGKCAEAGIGLAFCSPHGRFLARTCGESSGNVLLRREQYRIADDPARSCEIARTMIFGKLSNGAASIQRTLRDHAPRVADCGLEKAAANLRSMLPQVLAAADLDSLRGIEGAAATAYFDVLDHMLLSRKEAFFFHGRSRRPPLDRVNAMLSFAYSLLAHDCASALESVGLDSYVGFLHRDRPGRQSLALDLMEELRPCMADRFVLTLVNNRMLRPEDFQMQDSGAVLLSDDGRRKFLKAWQERKQDTLTHPYLGEKLSWGMIPYAQALLLARCLRGDLDGYPPFLWK